MLIFKVYDIWQVWSCIVVLVLVNGMGASSGYDSGYKSETEAASGAASLDAFGVAAEGSAEESAIHQC